MSIQLEDYLTMSSYNPVFLRDAPNIIPYTINQIGKTLTLEEQTMFQHKLREKTEKAPRASTKELEWFSLLISKGVEVVSFGEYELKAILTYRNACSNYVEWAGTYKFVRNNSKLVKYIKDKALEVMAHIKEDSEKQWDAYYELREIVIRSFFRDLVDRSEVLFASRVCVLMAGKTEELLEKTPSLASGYLRQSAGFGEPSKSPRLYEPAKLAMECLEMFFSDMNTHTKFIMALRDELTQKVGREELGEEEYAVLRSVMEKNGFSLYRTGMLLPYSPILDKIWSDSSGIVGPEYAYSIKEIIEARTFAQLVSGILTDKVIVREVLRDVTINKRSRDYFEKCVQILAINGLLSLVQAEEYLKEGGSNYGNF